MSRARLAAAMTAVFAAAVTVHACTDEGTVPLQPAAVAVVPAWAELAAAGSTVQLRAEVRDQRGQVMNSAEVAWTSSDPRVAVVDGTGMVTAVAGGDVEISATSSGVAGRTALTVGASASSVQSDRAALVALYNATDGPNWVNSENWLTDAPMGEWYGVSTDSLGRVTRLTLQGTWDGEARRRVPHGLSGPIPPELGSLAKLRVLWLWYNELTGAIPPELGNLANLEGLGLDGNEFDLANLERLAIPPELGNLANLEQLSLAGNELTGAIPAELGGLANLRGLWLYGNESTGAIPAELGNLANLEQLRSRRQHGRPFDQFQSGEKKSENQGHCSAATATGRRSRLRGRRRCTTRPGGDGYDNRGRSSDHWDGRARGCHRSR